MITLTLIEKHGPDGWQDEEGVIHYDTDFETPFGVLGNIRVSHVDGEWVIKEADGVVLFNRGFIDHLFDGKIEDGHTHPSVSALGLRTVLIDASNGNVRYQIHDDPLDWSDQPDAQVKCYLATLTHQDWANADD